MHKDKSLELHNLIIQSTVQQYIGISSLIRYKVNTNYIFENSIIPIFINYIFLWLEGGHEATIWVNSVVNTWTFGLNTSLLI